MTAVVVAFFLGLLAGMGLAVMVGLRMAARAKPATKPVEPGDFDGMLYFATRELLPGSGFVTAARAGVTRARAHARRKCRRNTSTNPAGSRSGLGNESALFRSGIGRV
jgi:hypothetical protein